MTQRSNLSKDLRIGVQAGEKYGPHLFVPTMDPTSLSVQLQQCCGVLWAPEIQALQACELLEVRGQRGGTVGADVITPAEPRTHKSNRRKRINN